MNYFKSRALKFFGITFVVRTVYMRSNPFKGDNLDISKRFAIKKLCVHAYVRTNYFKSRALKFFGITFVVRTAYMRTNLFKGDIWEI